jgi:phage head maturation protease
VRVRRSEPAGIPAINALSLPPALIALGTLERLAERLQALPRKVADQGPFSTSAEAHAVLIREVAFVVAALTRTYRASISRCRSDKAAHNAEFRTVDAIISMGSPVRRFYGTEVLRIAPDAVIVDRLASSGIPLLDSHQVSGISNALGRVTRVWFSGGALMGALAFNATAEGRKAEGMVARGEIAGISAGYCVRKWEIADQDGKVIDPEKEMVRWDDDLTFTATKWELHECSLVSVPADSMSGVRSLGSVTTLADIRAQMQARQNMVFRQARAFGDTDE